VGGLLELVLDSNLELENAVSVILVFDLLGNLLSLLIHSSLVEGLSVVHLVLVHVWVELGELVVHVSCIAVVLNLKVAVSEQRQSSSVSWLEVQLVAQDRDYLRRKEISAQI